MMWIRVTITLLLCIFVSGFWVNTTYGADDCCDVSDGVTATAEHDDCPDHDHDHNYHHNHDQYNEYSQMSAHDHADCPDCSSGDNQNLVHTVVPSTPPAWDDEIVEKFRHLPLQDGGRVKPLDTLARFKLLQLSGRTTVVNTEGQRLSATEWLMVSLFYPRYAEHLQTFLIQSPEVMDTLGLDHEKMRDRFTYAQLLPARGTLFRLAQQASHEDKYRTRVQEQLLNLAHNVHEFEMLTNYLEFARRDYLLGESEVLRTIFDGASSVSFSEAILHGPDIVQALISLRSPENNTAHAHANHDEINQAGYFFQQLEDASTSAFTLALFPPALTVEEEPEWLTPGEMLVQFLHPTADHEVRTTLLAKLESLENHKENPVLFSSQLNELFDGVVGLAEQRGEYRGVALEATYYRLKLLDYGLYLYIMAFIIIAFTWLRPNNRVFWWSAMMLVSLPLTLHISAIVLRCIIRLRPPVTTLYETILFAGAVVVLCALVVEYINRRRIGLGVAGFMGALCLFLANRYEVQEGIDTMPSLIAVLDTNFWLSIHVITMVMGYAGCLLASAMAHIYLLGKTFGFKEGNKDFYKTIARMTFGAICFGLLFNTVGTVLGGLWAADSWGRFWGWDPKENGAFLTVLWGLIIMHARMGGYIRDFGIQMAAIFGGITVAFAWFGVNLLGVGLHSYGFTDGIHGALMSFYTIESLVLFVSAIGWLRINGMLKLPLREKSEEGA